jgi:cell division protein FtsB
MKTLNVEYIQDATFICGEGECSNFNIADDDVLYIIKEKELLKLKSDFTKLKSQIKALKKEKELIEHQLNESH